MGSRDWQNRDTRQVSMLLEIDNILFLDDLKYRMHLSRNRVMNHLVARVRWLEKEHPEVFQTLLGKMF